MDSKAFVLLWFSTLVFLYFPTFKNFTPLCCGLGRLLSGGVPLSTLALYNFAYLVGEKFHIYVGEKFHII
jgi:hypothetical protein